MKSIKNNLVIKLLIASLIVFSLNFNIFGYVWNNGAGSGYEGDEGKSSVKEGTIKEYLIAGGGYYLSACSDIQKFLYLYEMQNGNGISIDYNKWEQVIDNALVNMTHAVETYDRLIKKAEVTPYDETVITWLRSFDYNGYMLDNGLNSVIFQCLAEFLKRGDITGLFKFIYSDLTNIKEMLVSIKGDLSINRVPEISIIRKLNESFSTLSLLGIYAPRIFYEKNF
jgi:hypothetical protein